MTAITPAYAHAYQVICLRTCPTLGPQHAKEAVLFKDGPSTLTVVPAWLMEETFAG